jgi:LacI family transcriptional regulator
VVTWSTSPDPEIPAISFDNAAAAEAATEMLIGLGHRCIGLICGLSAVNDRAAQRLEAYRRVLVRHRIRFRSQLVAERPFEVAEGASAAEAMMRLENRPTALFCANDIQALGAMFACQRLSLRIPDDVSIVGFDDLPLSRCVNPALSTVHVPAKEMGETAAGALIAAVEDGQPIASVRIEASVIIRGSTKSIDD